MSTAIRRNVAHLTVTERQAYATALRNVDLQHFADGVSFWDKQDQIHEGTHNHNGNSFIPWHRELVNRFETLLRVVDPTMALHYWDWTQDPRAASDGNGGTVNLMTPDTFGTASGMVTGTLAPLHNGGSTAGARPEFGGPFTLPPATITRGCIPGAPGVASDASILSSANGAAQAQQWDIFRQAVESSHNSAHVFFGSGTIFDPHTAFEDPFVFLLHSNVDRLFAMWQTQVGQDWRLDPGQVYGDQSNTTGPGGILYPLQPWDGTVEFGSPIPPWTGSSSEISVKNSRHPSVVGPACYDTLPLTATLIAPSPPAPIRFLDVEAGEQTARAVRIRIRGCHSVTATATLSGGIGFSLLASTVTSPEPTGFTTEDLLVWVRWTAGAAGTSTTSTVTVTITETGDTFTVPITANAIAKQTVAASLVLDRSGSMDAPSGVGTLTRMELLRNAAPLFVNLLDDTDGVGVVRFDTDAAEAAPIQVTGGQIGGLGRSAALTAITTHATNTAGMTAIGDGLEAAAAQLAIASGFTKKATVVFTDGEETEPKYIADVASLVTSQVFAIGLGTADQVNPIGLKALVAGTNGYVLLTGNAGPDDLLLVQKYFAQVIAGVTNTQIVVDPDVFVPPGASVDTPFVLTAGDTRCDAIVLSPLAQVLRVELVAPDGTVVDSTTGATQVGSDNHIVLRLPLPTPAVSGLVGGEWLVRLSVDKRMLKRWMSTHDNDRELIERLAAHGVPATITVQAKSAVRMSLATSQTSNRPGATALITATLTESDIPLAHTSRVVAHIRRPDDSTTDVRLIETDGGVFTSSVDTPDAGVYRVLVTAEGGSLSGDRFTREELRSLAVWGRGDGVPPTSGPTKETGGLDACKFITCLLKQDSIRKAADRLGIDPDEVVKCLDGACRHH